MENKSGIHPVGHYLLVLPESIENITDGGIILPNSSVESEKMRQTQAIIVELGESVWHDQPTKWAEVGDFVSFGLHSGSIRKGNDGKQYRIIKDLDINSILDKGDSNE